MNYTSLLVICLLLAGKVQSQKITVSFNKVIKTTKSEEGTYRYPIATDDNYSYSEIYSGFMDKNCSIQKIELKTGQVIWTKELPFPRYANGLKTLYVETIKTKTGFIVFRKEYSGKLKSHILEAYVADEDLNLSKEPKIVAKSLSKESQVSFSITQKGAYFYISEYEMDGSKNSRKNVNSNFTVLDHDLNKISEKGFLPVKDKYYQFERTFYSDSNTLISVVKISENGKKFHDKAVSLSYAFLIHDFKTDKTIEQAIQLGGKFKYYTEPSVNIDPYNNRVSIVTQYHTTQSDKGHEGLYIMIFDLDQMKLTSSKTIPYGKEITEQLVDKKALSKGMNPGDMLIQSFRQNDDDSYTLLMEEYRTFITATQSGNTTSYRTGHVHGHILMLQISGKENEGLLDHTIIKRVSETADQQTPTFFSKKTDEFLYILFNATGSSIQAAESGGSYESIPDNNVLFCAIYDTNGDQVGTEMIKPKDAKSNCNVKNFTSVNDHTLEIPFIKRDPSSKITETTTAVIEFE